MFARLFQCLRSLRRPLTDGQRGERVAERFLRRQSYRILARNLRSQLGEIDLLAQAPDGRTIVLVEVKARALPVNAANSSDQSPRPEVHVNAHKQRKLSALAAQIARRFKLHDRPIRFDVIGVDLLAEGGDVIRHHVAAFESTI